SCLMSKISAAALKIETTLEIENDILLSAITDLQKSQAWYKENAVYERNKLSGIWIGNLHNHFKKVFVNAENCTIKDVISFLSDKAFFDVSAPAPQRSYAISWFADLLEQKYPGVLENLPPDAGESAYFADDRCEIRDGRRVSSDFMSRLCMV